MQQRLLERQELLVLGGNVPGAKPVPIALPPVVLESFIWSGGHVGRPGTSLAPLSPLCFAPFSLSLRAYSSAFLNGKNCLS